MSGISLWCYTWKISGWTLSHLPLHACQKTIKLNKATTTNKSIQSPAKEPSSVNTGKHGYTLSTFWISAQFVVHGISFCQLTWTDSTGINPHLLRINQAHLGFSNKCNFLVFETQKIVSNLVKTFPQKWFFFWNLPIHKTELFAGVC